MIARAALSLACVIAFGLIGPVAHAGVYRMTLKDVTFADGRLREQQCVLRIDGEGGAAP